MDLEIAGRTALVTGSSRGIGNAIAKKLVREGCAVAINGRNTDNLAKSLAELPGAHAVAGDVSEPAQAQKVVSEAIARLGKLDILVCNVGSGASVAPGMETHDEWQKLFAINLWSATNVIEAARQALTESRGVILCMSSICGAEVIPGAPITYSAAKAALNAYVRGIARPLGQSGIRINAIAPGNILFEGSVWSRKLKADEDAVRMMLEQNVSLGRLGTPEEVADLAAYLVSPRAGFATGGIWTLDGGQVHA
jgi:3-oxoacyl-[acyl-carrier protein] reductase